MIISLPPGASPIIPGLYQGGIDSNYLDPKPDIHVACAHGAYPHPESADKVIYFPLHDDPTVIWADDLEWVRRAVEVAQTVATGVVANKNVVVSCQAGLNRSGLVLALAMCILGYEPADAIQTIRDRRSVVALHNPRFVEVIMRYGGSLADQAKPSP